ncbi:hypothetical protein MLD38_014400 [Melastoma candidum]|uniref:Uncharacterized protein n=1 Tax=Melastoma candidum TaxID=119954 RepID=A0ACB9RCA4_9MYRT|nr:hypothetical protein MLD38_014400 [Melastoma candidum]
MILLVCSDAAVLVVSGDSGGYLMSANSKLLVMALWTTLTSSKWLDQVEKCFPCKILLFIVGARRDHCPRITLVLGRSGPKLMDCVPSCELPPRAWNRLI